MARARTRVRAKEKNKFQRKESRRLGNRVRSARGKKKNNGNFGKGTKGVPLKPRLSSRGNGRP